jgi:hypothetical protein
MQNLSFIKEGHESTSCKRKKYQRTPKKTGFNGKTFDYMQNILLPQTLLQELFYYRQRLIHEFCIHDVKSNNTFFTRIEKERH